MEKRARPEEPNLALAVVLAWLIPGAGHIYLGKWQKGLFFFASMVPLYLYGVYLGRIPPMIAPLSATEMPPVNIVSPVSHPVYFSVQVFAGLPTLTVTGMNIIASAREDPSEARAAEEFGFARPGMMQRIVMRLGLVNSLTVMGDLGVIITSVVGALNFILMMHVLCGAPEDD